MTYFCKVFRKTLCKMKKNKIILLSVLFISVLNYSYSQKYHIFIEDGYVQPQSIRSAFNENYSTYAHGRKSGINVQVEFKKNFSLLTGVLSSTVYSSNIQNFKSDSIYTGKVSTYKFGIYLDVPVQVNYSLKVAKNLNLFAFAGPNVNIGLAMPRHTDASLSPSVSTSLREQLGYTYTTGMDDMYKEGLIHRVNVQLGAGGGIQWKNYQLKAGYDFGINNLNRKNIYKLHDNSWGVSLTYRLATLEQDKDKVLMRKEQREKNKIQSAKNKEQNKEQRERNKAQRAKSKEQNKEQKAKNKENKAKNKK